MNLPQGAHHTDHKVAQAESAEFKEVNIAVGEAYKQGSEIVLRIKDLNSFVGERAGRVTTGNNNNFMGYRAGYYNIGGNNNNFMGYRAGYSNTTGSYNASIGTQAGYYNTTGNRNVSIGNAAGFYESGSDKLFIDNRSRANEADGRIEALIYGVFDAAVANQLVRLNAKKVEMPQLGDYADDAAAATGGIAVGGLYRNGSIVQVRVT